jgi:hypothetical protein
MTTEGPREGEYVAYVGEGDDDLAVDDRGKVLSAAGMGSHVLWSTGKRAGEITLTRNHDLVVRRAARYDDDLDSGVLVSIAVRDVYDRQGDRGLLRALADEGHFACFTPVAVEAVRLVAQRLREDPSIKEVLAHLDPDEGAEFVGKAAGLLLRDALSEVE